jgi:hypothetical protein
MARRRKNVITPQESGYHNPCCDSENVKIISEKSEEKAKDETTDKVPDNDKSLSTGYTVESDTVEEVGSVKKVLVDVPLDVRVLRKDLYGEYYYRAEEDPRTPPKVTDPNIRVQVLRDQLVTCSNSEERVADIVEHNRVEFERRTEDNRDRAYLASSEFVVSGDSVRVEFGARGESCTQWLEIKKSQVGSGYTAKAYWYTVDGTLFPDQYCKVTKYYQGEDYKCTEYKDISGYYDFTPREDLGTDDEGEKASKKLKTGSESVSDEESDSKPSSKY